MNPQEPFGGRLELHPGRARPHNLRSTRPDWVARLTHGLPPRQLPPLLARLFNVCGHAHLRCAQMAVDAALGRCLPPTLPIRTELATLTLKEHLRRIWLDWPQQLDPSRQAPGLPADAASELARCPAFGHSPQDLPTWLRANALGTSLAAWLEHWEQDPRGWLTAWSADVDTPVARWLRQCRTVADAPLPEVAALQVHADAESMRRWARVTNGLTAGVHRPPQWQERCAETGVWTRLGEARSHRLDTPWLRLGARLAEVVRLSLPDGPARSGATWLSLGALAPEAGQGIGWAEMSRGLLLHQVRLDGPAETARVVSCRVLAPTDWNFHPVGAVAQFLERLPARPTLHDRFRLALVMAGYDPCVPYQCQWPTESEASHA